MHISSLHIFFPPLLPVHSDKHVLFPSVSESETHRLFLAHLYHSTLAQFWQCSSKDASDITSDRSWHYICWDKLRHVSDWKFWWAWGRDICCPLAVCMATNTAIAWSYPIAKTAAQNNTAKCSNGGRKREEEEKYIVSLMGIITSITKLNEPLKMKMLLHHKIRTNNLWESVCSNC